MQGCEDRKEYLKQMLDSYKWTIWQANKMLKEHAGKHTVAMLSTVNIYGVILSQLITQLELKYACKERGILMRTDDSLAGEYLDRLPPDLTNFINDDDTDMIRAYDKNWVSASPSFFAQNQDNPDSVEDCVQNLLDVSNASYSGPLALRADFMSLVHGIVKSFTGPSQLSTVDENKLSELWETKEEYAWLSNFYVISFGGDNPEQYFYVSGPLGYPLSMDEQDDRGTKSIRASMSEQHSGWQYRCRPPSPSCSEVFAEDAAHANDEEIHPWLQYVKGVVADIVQQLSPSSKC